MDKPICTTALGPMAKCSAAANLMFACGTALRTHFSFGDEKCGVKPFSLKSTVMCPFPFKNNRKISEMDQLQGKLLVDDND